MNLKNEIKRSRRLEKEALEIIRHGGEIQKSNILKRGKDGTTTYALVPKRFRDEVKTGVCISRLIKRRNATYLIFEMRK